MAAKPKKPERSWRAVHSAKASGFAYVARRGRDFTLALRGRMVGGETVELLIDAKLAPIVLEWAIARSAMRDAGLDYQALKEAAERFAGRNRLTPFVTDQAQIRHIDA